MKNFDLTILTTTDIHGYIFSIDYTTKHPIDYGLAKISTVIKNVRMTENHVLYFDDGDSIQGSPLEYYHGNVDNSKADPTIKALNYLKCDAMTIGNHEFNFGRKVLEKAISEAAFPITSANIVYRATGKPAFGKGYVIFDFDEGPKVAYLCLTTKYIPFWEDPEYIEDIDFLDPIETAEVYIRDLKNSGVDVIIVGYHGGFEKDPDSGEIISELTDENQGYEMANTLEEVSAYIFGHQHKSFATKIKDIPVIMASSWGKALGKIDLKLSFDDKWTVQSSEVKLLKPDLLSDKEMLKMEKSYQIIVQKWLDEPIGEAAGDFCIPDVMYARTHETALLNLINDVQLHYSDAQISATAIFSSEIRGWKKGTIRRRDVMGVYIFSNTLKVFSLKGVDIKNMIEHSASYFDLKDGRVASSGDLAGYKYNIFKGISYTMDLTKEKGKRVVKLEINGSTLDENAEYTIAVNSYQAGGNGGYTMFLGKKPIKEIKVQIADLIIEYIQNMRIIKPEIEGSWNIVY
ncbi:MAG: bifunctional metallophosphatase/5'-nucleotidase [Thermotogae bacterium]|nr:bifunctional metallophosphatase/5'-nucleotidase [Thermotogota bacterium]